MPVPSDIVLLLGDPPHDPSNDAIPDYASDDFSDIRRQTAQVEECDESRAIELLVFA